MTGCLAERYRDELKTEIPEIDAVLGTGEVPGDRRRRSAAGDDARVAPLLPSRVAADIRTAGADTRLSRVDRPTYLYDADTPRLLATPGHYAYVKIAEAATTSARSASSRRCAAITAAGRPTRSSREARALAARGVKELLLISQDTTFYGIDRGERGALARLLRELNGVDGLEWIRLLYLYPTTINDDVLAAMADCEKV